MKTKLLKKIRKVTLTMQGIADKFEVDINNIEIV